MNHVRALAGALAASAASLFFVGEAAGEPAHETTSAWVATNARSGPGFGFSVAYRVDRGTSLSIVCSATDAAGSTWYKLADGNYVLAVVTGGASVPDCGGAP